jgi:ABC-type uncharacterized transport system involved in gliding motility auxiliary subunit
MIAGPTKKFSQAEMDILDRYLNNKGRILVLVDPGTVTGLETLLGQWGVSITDGVVVGLTLTGEDLVVNEYGDHAITRPMTGITTMFYAPLGILPRAAQGNRDTFQSDKPRVTVLVSNTADGWLEFDPRQVPPKFDPGVDLAGPVPLALAVEKGPITGIDVEISPTRLAIFGESVFVSNEALQHGVGGNADLFMNAVNWLLERESLIAVSPRDPDILSLALSRSQLRMAYFIIVLGIPLEVILIGLVVMIRRKR